MYNLSQLYILSQQVLIHFSLWNSKCNKTNNWQYLLKAYGLHENSAHISNTVGESLPGGL